ncbi:D-alanyl-D-alanine carboxypeptidase family protein [Paenibacillus sp. GCM10012307]|uniref:M15 family metallopeptidase n=1 Tax=Paenibacillus roseus TaxID=2798579 RepID=A0A934MM19_9BACL|nr:M15 family metallopeptidase [Paenibacillus roseus]MBJ6362830.1 M15 family metallopeptidase [Paenibacillus roseus]
MKKLIITIVALAISTVLFSACSSSPAAPGNNQSDQVQEGADKPATNAGGLEETGESNGKTNGGAPDDQNTDGKNTNAEGGSKGNQGSQNPKDPAVEAASNPKSIAVLVNKQFSLPENYTPTDLVYPDVPFTFKDKIEKRMMRKEAAAALEEMFAGAEKDNIYLAGVSAYRSHQTQKALFERYVKKDGEEKAKTYSAVPGHSEHETGLAIDVSASNGKCAAEDCFGGTPEAKWLAKHAYEYGFIIRYPQGKDSITGYKYEPWHLRYVGTEISKDMNERGITLEEYYDAVPVTNP